MTVHSRDHDRLFVRAVLMPPLAPLDMPEQAFSRRPDRVRAPAGGCWAACGPARALAFGGAAALTSAGAVEMQALMGDRPASFLAAAFLFLFALTFGWVAFAATSALAGLLPAGRERPSPREFHGDEMPTALVMPIYLEDPIGVAARLEAIARELAALTAAAGFEIVVLSDTNEADAWVGEAAAFDRLKQRLDGIMPLFYRCRFDNAAKKAGNLAQFVRLWGARYRFMIVLDADSLMSAQTLVELRARMQADPGLGLLQTVPRLIGAQTGFARLQQFATSLYGPVAARGVAAWSGSDGNYWGHNAILRMDAFAACCGLPELRGRAPFGGHILSHDFVEAALLRRAGWRVEMAPDLAGSFEEGPPTLTDAAIRDRRWAQGNLQHASVLGARGLRWASRAHMLIGIGSYAVSPLWMLLISVGLALAVKGALAPPEYFHDPHQLFPDWPVFDAKRMQQLFVLTLTLVFLPKAIGIVRGLSVRAIRRGHGGPARLLAGAAVEIAFASLIAPVVMVLQTRDVLSILAGRSSGWTPQRRTSGHMPWRMAARPYVAPMLIGVGVSVAAAFVSTNLVLWMAPFSAGLLLAVPLGVLSGDARISRILVRQGLMRTPEDLAPPPVAVSARAIEAADRQLAVSGGVDQDRVHLAFPVEDEVSDIVVALVACKIGVVADQLDGLEDTLARHEIVVDRLNRGRRLR